MLECSNLAAANANEEADTTKRLEIRILSYNVAGIKNKEYLHILPVYINCHHWERDSGKLYVVLAMLD